MKILKLLLKITIKFAFYNRFIPADIEALRKSDANTYNYLFHQVSDTIHALLRFIGFEPIRIFYV